MIVWLHYSSRPARVGGFVGNETLSRSCEACTAYVNQSPRWEITDDWHPRPFNLVRVTGAEHVRTE